MSRLARATLVTLAATLLLVAVGGLVRATDSGLGCGDSWPHCYGHWIPPFGDFEATLAPDSVPDLAKADIRVIDEGPDGVTVEVDSTETWIEWTHRLLGTVVGLLTIGLTVGAVRRRKGDPDTFRIGRFLLPLVVAQGLLGAYVVHQELQAWTVVAHLAMATAFMATLIMLLVHLTTARSREPVDSRVVRLSAVAGLAAYGQALVGSYVTGRHAGLAFTDWPLMDGSVLPSHLDVAAPFLQFAHRILALAVGAVVGYVAWEIWRRGGRRVRRLAALGAGLYGAQVLVGGVNVFTELHALPVTLHLALAVAIVGCFVGAWAVARRTPALSASMPTRPRTPMGASS